MAIPGRHKEFVYQEADYQCAYCGQKEDGPNLTLHHIKEKKKNGEDHYNNLILLCYNCQNRIHRSSGISIKAIRKLKRHLVHRLLTQPGVNVLKLAYPSRLVVAPPFAVQHLVERRLLEPLGPVETFTYETGEFDEVLPGQRVEISAKVEVTILLKITREGKKLVEDWLK